MRHFIYISSLLIVFAAHAASAEDAFVIEAEKAQPEVGVQITGDTIITIEPGGYLIAMTESGQIIRQDGPYDGPAGDRFSVSGGGPTMEGGLLESLLELAEVSGTATQQLGAVRGTVVEDASARPDAISTGVSVFCMKQNARPEFFTSKAPAVDEPLIVRRRGRPIQFLQGTWPAGAQVVTWPSDWPPAEEGRYIWALGSRGSSALKIITVDDVSNPLELAATYYNLGCEGQAKAMFRQALSTASQ